MSNTNSHIARQWQIIQFLTKTDGYVSSQKVFDYLSEKGINTSVRTVQRDLVDLAEIFPLERRTDDKPHSWRWQKITDAKSQDLDLYQAVILRLVETQLTDVVPPNLLERLEPILMKARLMLAYDERFDSVGSETLQSLTRIQEIKKHGFGTPDGLMPSPLWKTSLLSKMLDNIGHKLTGLNPLDHDQKVSKSDLKALQKILKDNDIDFNIKL